MTDCKTIMNWFNEDVYKRQLLFTLDPLFIGRCIFQRDNSDHKENQGDQAETEEHDGLFRKGDRKRKNPEGNQQKKKQDQTGCCQKRPGRGGGFLITFFASNEGGAAFQIR